MAGKKYIRRNPTSGLHEEQNTPQTSADTPVAGDIPALGTGGKIQNDLLNVVSTSAGAGDASKLPILDGSGRLDSSVMPVGIAADTKSILTSEALAAGDLVNVWNDAGTMKCRKADGNSSGKRTHGFVLAGFSSGANAVVYFEGENTQVSGLTAGQDVYMSTATAGGVQNTVPTGSTKVHQNVGVATGTTSFNFEPQDPVVLA